MAGLKFPSLRIARDNVLIAGAACFALATGAALLLAVLSFVVFFVLIALAEGLTERLRRAWPRRAKAAAPH